MQKRGLFILLLLGLALFLIACQEPLYGEALKVPPASLGNQQEQVQREAIQRFGSGTQVTVDSQGKPALVLGKLAIKTKKVATITEKTLPLATADFLAKYKRFFRISPQDLKPARQWCDTPLYPGKKEGICSIFYQQQYRGIPVYQSLVGITTNGGNVVLVQNKYYSGISVPTTPTLRQAKAIEIAQQHLEETVQPLHVSLVIYPEEKEEKIRFYLAYQIAMPPVWKGPMNVTEHDRNVPAALTYFIDAHTGNVIAYHNRIRAQVEGTVQGMIFPNHRLQEKESRLFAHETVIAGTVEAVTNSTGTYSAATTPDTAVGITTQANGPFVSVVNRQQELSRYTAQGWSPSIHNIEWRNHDLSYEQEESNAFYHANIIHDFVTKSDPFDVHEMDYPLEVAVEEGRANGAQCNAYSWCDPWNAPGDAQRSGVAFFGPGDRCDSIALSADVVYHEYTHSIVCNIYPEGLFPYWDESGGLNEALADYFGATIPDDSCMSDYFFREEFIEKIRASWPDAPLVKLWPCLRNLDNDKTYPKDYNPEPHDASEVFSASLWDLRESLGAPLTDELVIRTMKLLPFRFKEFLDGMLVIDDDNANLNDGTPHSRQICQAFSQHGLSTRSCSGQLEEPLVQLVKPEEGSVTLGKDRVTIYGTVLAESGTAFQSYAVDYAPAGTEEWSAAGITLTLSGAHPAAYNEPIATANLDAAGFQGKYVLRLRAIDTSGKTQEVRVIVSIFKNGWPSFQNRWIYGNQILVTDFEGDGFFETVLTDHSSIWPAAFNLQVAYNAEGEAVLGFVSSQYERQFLSAADIDNDGIVELVSQAWEWTSEQNKLLIFDPYEEYWRDEGGIPFFFFRTRVVLEDAGKEGCRPTLADLDGDGMMEIAMRTKNKIWLFRQDGSLVDGWPKDTLPSSSYCPNGNSLVAVADLDTDGIEDLIVAEESVEKEAEEVVIEEAESSSSSGGSGGGGSGGNASEGIDEEDTEEMAEEPAETLLVHAWHGDGSPVAGWPVQLATSAIRTLLVAETNVWEEKFRERMPIQTRQAEGLSTPIPRTNVIVGGDKTFVLRSSGEIISEFYGPWNFLVGNVDGKLRLLDSSGMYEDEGQFIAQYQRAENEWLYNPHVADSDGDGTAEVLLIKYHQLEEWISAIAGIVAYGKDGLEKQRWSIPDTWKAESFIVDDINADKKADIIFPMEKGLIFLPLEGSADDIQWGQKGIDNRQTNVVKYKAPLLREVERPVVQEGVQREVRRR